MSFERPKGITRFQTLSAQRSPLPSAELDAEFNALMDAMNSFSVDPQQSTEWFDPSKVCTYVNATTFTADGDETATFPVTIRVKALCASTGYSSVASSTYSSGTNKTTVVLADAVLISPIVAVHVSVVKPIANNGSITPQMIGAAPLNSPNLTGTPTAPTAAPGTSTTQLATTAFVSAVYLPAGSIIFIACNTAPTGYLKANGAAVSRATYSALFTAIGTTFGVGDGSTTFNLPDLRGEFVRGWDDSRGADSGRSFGTAQSSANLSHNHGVNDPSHAHSIYTSYIDGNAMYSGVANINGQGGVIVYESTFSATTGISIQSNGTTESRPRNVALLACIKY
jgi:microcystin-dependent protein